MSRAFEDGKALTMMVDRCIASRNITRQQYKVLSKLVLADGTIDEAERYQINRLFDAIQTGRIKVVE